MGYIHDVSMSQFVPPNLFMFSVGTWTATIATSIWSMDRTAADASFYAFVPVLIPSNSVANMGAYLKSIEVMYSIATAAADDFASVSLIKDTLAVDGTLNTKNDIAITMDTAHDTAAERLAIDEHRMVATLDTAAWIDNDEAYHLDLGVDCAAGTVFKCFGAIINYTLRL
jgi:hypothetical protein